MSKTNIVNQSVQENLEFNKAEHNEKISGKELKHEINKSLNELKEMAIVLRQKLDTLQSERNVMDVEYSQVSHLVMFILNNDYQRTSCHGVII